MRVCPFHSHVFALSLISVNCGMIEKFINQLRREGFLFLYCVPLRLGFCNLPITIQECSLKTILFNGWHFELVLVLEFLVLSGPLS